MPKLSFADLEAVRLLDGSVLILLSNCNTNMEESKQRLLPSQRGSYDSESLESYQTGRTQTIAYRLKKTYPSILAFVLVLSILLNIILFGAYHQAQSKRYLCPSEYSKLLLVTHPSARKLILYSWAGFDYDDKILAKHRVE
jgi:hypothetical protein